MCLQAIGLIIGIIYLWWEYKADWKVWIASMVMPCISMVIYYTKGLYADFAINIYYLLMAVYGYYAWTRGKGKDEKEEKPLPITHASRMAWVWATVATAILWYGIWMLLVKFTDSTVPVADAFTTALSIVGLWMMARKYAEQWLIWFVVDIVSSILYFYKQIPFYGVLYAIYTVVSLFGYRKWIRMMHESLKNPSEDYSSRES